MLVSDFLNEMSRLKRMGEHDNALSKLMRSATSESKAGAHENAALFFSEAGKMLSKLGLSKDTRRVSELYTKAGIEYEEAAKRLGSFQSHEAASLYRMAAQMYGLSKEEGDVREAIRCYDISASFYKDAARMSQASDEPKEHSDSLWILSAESNVSSSKLILSIKEYTRGESIRAAELSEMAANAYHEIGYIGMSMSHLIRATDLVGEPRTRDELELLLRLLAKTSGLYEISAKNPVESVERVETYKILSSQLSMSAVTAAEGFGIRSRSDAVRIAELYEIASDSFIETGSIKKSMACLDKALAIIGSPKSPKESALLQEVLSKKEKNFIREQDVSGAAECVIEEEMLKKASRDTNSK